MENINTLAWRAVLVSGLALAWVAPTEALEEGTLTIDNGERTYRLTVEIARTAKERSYGLMERDRLAADAGMLFVYPQRQSPSTGFWMHRTKIPLDIAFIGSEGTIRAIDSMVPCGNDVNTRCPTYPAGVPFQYALEVNAGFFETHDIEVGDRVDLP
ncbi:DUF192 domain-containing protein [Halomonas sp. McH1-25]|uniref:DUF192 domain-containing protein n=1 Tax=unclassified Halomonas TaxID=2609666 RepID=UPI001EF477A2|nr:MULTISPECIES: DUF192 domain-containing protein [unclassified Halomonas]MCG7599212.1 DUF192 domain-containing protein [Halomonas sp. McH1-25]MCP1341080.1 DUF192 domain-containing protein [Halomonas sp. FL8]MCP1361700.1 DUF192 domain-containing protein [Halomonas sp. BBD45]